MSKSILESILCGEFTIATEADDITKDVSNEVKSTLGEKEELPEVPDEASSELDKIKDIFPTKGKDNTKKDSGVPDNNINPPQDQDSDEEVVDGITPVDDQALQTSEDEETDNMLFAEKNRVRDNMIQLYNNIASNIEVIVNAMNNVNNKETLAIYNSVLGNLRNSNDFLYNTLTNKIDTLSYDELLRIYITIKQVYDICIEMLQKHVDKSGNK